MQLWRMPSQHEESRILSWLTYKVCCKLNFQLRNILTLLYYKIWYKNLVQKVPDLTLNFSQHCTIDVCWYYWIIHQPARIILIFRQDNVVTLRDNLPAWQQSVTLAGSSTNKVYRVFQAIEVHMAFAYPISMQ